MQRYIVQNIKLPFEASKDVVLAQAKRRLLKFFAKKDIVRAEIAKRSVDARKKNDIKFVWSVWAEIASDEKLDASRLATEGIALSKSAALEIKHGDESLSGRPLIVGFGPCGMFCALILARNGYRPIVIERGADVNKRASDVETFMKTGKLDAESNVQFGAGGAGTFSDGKLVTRINDPKCSLVIDEMHRHGAPEDLAEGAERDGEEKPEERVEDRAPEEEGEDHLGVVEPGAVALYLRGDEVAVRELARYPHPQHAHEAQDASAVAEVRERQGEREAR